MNTTGNFEQSGTGVSAGRVLGGRYRLDTLIASGGMGEVYRSTRLHIGDEVAVKVLRSELVDNATTRERFQREARAAARLRHPNAVIIHDFGEEPDGVAYIVMELLDGRSLRQVLDEEGMLESARVNRLLAQISAVLNEGHKQGIVHRDLKPENIVLLERPDTGQGREEQVKLLDFGIAKLLDKALEETDQESKLTKVGTLIGTPSYMSPEQFEGEPVDERTDIYSLGVVLFELLTGQVPFVAKTPTGVAIKHVMDPPPRLRDLQPSLSEAVERVVLRALEKKPAMRQPTMPALAQEFAAAVGPTGESASTVDKAAPSISPSAATLTDPSTQVLSSGRDTNRQPRDTHLQGRPKPSYDTVVGAIAEPIPVDSVSERFDTDRLAASANAAVPDNSPAALLVRLKQQPLLVGIIVGSVLLGLVGWWLLRPPTETEPSQVVSAPTPTPASAPNVTPTSASAPTDASENMVYIPGGSLLLNTSTDGKCPTVVITLKPYYLDKTEVTNEEYLLFVLANNYARPPSWRDGQFAAGTERLPVTDVSWEDAANYAAWKSKRLPTEAEWEFAARGTNDWVYPWGNEWRADYANVGSQQLRAVGSFTQASSPFNALDLIGNAAEWTMSDYSPCAQAEPTTPDEPASKVVRGGSYESTPRQATATFRQGLPAKRQNNVNLKAVGFRCARDAQ
jgi:eukaryotic-like serine/threonine-protein kinase